MNTTSTQKCSRPSESGSDAEGASWKMDNVASESVKVTSFTTLSNDAVAHEDSVTHETDRSNESELQTVPSKSKKRRQRASTSQGPAANTGPRPATAPMAMPVHVASGPANAPTTSHTAPTAVFATEHTMLASASS
ncbi:hypothetical protein MRX96_017175 [Rhipicephalus microplus]